MHTLQGMAQQAREKKGSRSALSRTLVTSELLDRATELFAAKGYEATSLQDIAGAAGISRPALYHYVSSKEDLLVMLVEQVSQGLAEVLGELSERADLTPTHKLRMVTELLVRQRAQHPAQFRILDRSETVLPEPAGSEHREAKRRVLNEVVALIDEGIATGEFRHVDSRTASLSLFGMCNWVAWWYRPDIDVDGVVAEISDFTRLMLAAPDPQEPSSRSTIIREIKERLDLLEHHS